MKKLLIVGLVFVLIGCAPKMIFSNKSPNYLSKFGELVIIIDTPVLKEPRLLDLSQEGINNKIKMFISDLTKFSDTKLVKKLSDNGIKATTLVSDSVQSTAEVNKYSHRLNLYIQSWSATCYHQLCQISYKLNVSLSDLTMNKTVWIATFSMLEPNSFQSLTESAAEELFLVIAKEVTSFHVPK